MSKKIDLAAAIAAAQTKKDGRIDTLLTSFEQSIGEAGLLLQDLGSVDDASLKDNVRIARIQDAKSRVEAMVRAGHQTPNSHPAHEPEDNPPAEGGTPRRRTRQNPPAAQPAPAPAEKPAAKVKGTKGSPKKAAEAPAAPEPPAATPAVPEVPATPPVKGPGRVAQAISWALAKG
jgi:hypothetical protein